MSKAKKFKTAQGFLEAHYNNEFNRYGFKETKEEKIRRSDQAARNAICALMPAIGLSAEIGDEQRLKEALLRIQQLPEAQNSRAQYFLKGARGRIIAISSTFIETRTTTDAA
jgi:hypothetical protein